MVSKKKGYLQFVQAMITLDTCFPVGVFSNRMDQNQKNNSGAGAQVHLFMGQRPSHDEATSCTSFLGDSAGDILSSDEQTRAFLLQWDIDAFHEALYRWAAVWKGNKRT